MAWVTVFLVFLGSHMKIFLSIFRVWKQIQWLHWLVRSCPVCRWNWFWGSWHDSWVRVWVWPATSWIPWSGVLAEDHYFCLGVKQLDFIKLATSVMQAMNLFFVLGDLSEKESMSWNHQRRRGCCVNCWHWLGGSCMLWRGWQWTLRHFLVEFAFFEE